MSDVDFDAASKNIAAKKTGNAGQTCVCYNRIYIHASIYGAVCKKVQEYLKEIVIGKGRDEGRVMGSMINRASRDRMLELISDAVKGGAKLVAGGEIPKDTRPLNRAKLCQRCKRRFSPPPCRGQAAGRRVRQFLLVAGGILRSQAPLDDPLTCKAEKAPSFEGAFRFISLIPSNFPCIDISFSVMLEISRHIN